MTQGWPAWMPAFFYNGILSSIPKVSSPTLTGCQRTFKVNPGFKTAQTPARLQCSRHQRMSFRQESTQYRQPFPMAQKMQTPAVE
jgi:hypothetical protein